MPHLHIYETYTQTGSLTVCLTDDLYQKDILYNISSDPITANYSLFFNSAFSSGK